MGIDGGTGSGVYGATYSFQMVNLGRLVGLVVVTERGLPSDFPNFQIRVVGGDDGGCPERSVSGATTFPNSRFRVAVGDDGG